MTLLHLPKEKLLYLLLESRMGIDRRNDLKIRSATVRLLCRKRRGETRLRQMSLRQGDTLRAKGVTLLRALPVIPVVRDHRHHHPPPRWRNITITPLPPHLLLYHVSRSKTYFLSLTESHKQRSFLAVSQWKTTTETLKTRC